MPRQLALLIYSILICSLFWLDRNNKYQVSRGVLIPQIWMLIAGSRFVSHWLNIFGIHVSYSKSVVEGSPVDRAFYLILIISGIIVLVRRKVSWHEIISENRLVWLFFLYGAVSILWSDYPLVSTKRWIKSFGNVIMALLILTESSPYQALGLILRRMAFILLPLSILFIKYYPELGRAYHMGVPMFSGVATHKNGLGSLCLVTGIYFVWSLILERKCGATYNNRKLIISTINLGMIAWLLYKTNSATSTACMIVASGLFVLASHPAIKQRPMRVMSFCIAGIAVFGILDFLFDIQNMIITMLGRRPDLTTRVPMWQDLLSMVKHPVIGFGYESFWLGPRREYMAEYWGITIQAHNGYLEMYLNLGVIGVLFLLSWILLGLKRVARYLTVNYPAGVFRLCIILVVALYNWTEATFYGVNNMWLLFLFAIMDPLEPSI